MRTAGNLATMRAWLPHAAGILIASVVFSCGDNLFRSVDSGKDPLDAATRELEKQNPAKAIEILLNELGEDVRKLLEGNEDASLSAELYQMTADRPDYEKYLSVLSAAYAQQAGLDPIDLVLKMAGGGAGSGEDSNEDASGEGEDVTSLFSILPDATPLTIATIDKSLYILQAVAETESTPADIFKMSILLTASFTIKIKAMDIDGDGTISLQETLQLDDAAAAQILGSLANAVLTMNEYTSSSGGDGNENASQTGDKLATIQGKIASADGDSDAEKLSNYLAASGSQATAP